MIEQEPLYRLEIATYPIETPAVSLVAKLARLLPQAPALNDNKNVSYDRTIRDYYYAPRVVVFSEKNVIRSGIRVGPNLPSSCDDVAS